jgi:NAD(P)-dependent dehydrogenase (short-subunit alcohol dehydrogenase family)
MIDLNGKVVVVTGASGTLGRAAARVFANANASLVLTGRNKEQLEETARQLDADKVIISCDLSDIKQIDALLNEAIKHYGRLDVLLNIAGGFSMGPKVHELSQADFESMFNMNFIGTFNTCRRIIPHMIKQGCGNVVNVSARAGIQGKAKMAPYCISKSAVITLTESLADEHKLSDININCVLPGTIDTDTNREDMPTADHSTWVPPVDIANTMLFLSSPLSRSVSGAVIPVYGKS